MARMNRAFISCSALLLVALFTPPAFCAGGLSLTWGDCGQAGAGQAVQSFACDTDVGSEPLYCALVTPEPVDSVLGIEITIDLQVAGASLPDWWRFDTGGCRDGALHADVDFGALSTCRDMWVTSPSGGFSTYTVGMPHGGANQARIKLAFAVPTTEALSLEAVFMYYAARLLLPNVGSTGDCAGCQSAACLVLNQITLLRPPRPEGTPSADVVIANPVQGTSNWAGWQTLSAGSCQAVPVQNRTWGAVKSLYR